MTTAIIPPECTPFLESAQGATSVMAMKWMEKNQMDWVKKNQTERVNVITAAAPQRNMVSSYTTVWLLYNVIAIHCSYLYVVHYNYTYVCELLGQFRFS